jgi:phosphoribosyl 1,2-cyclic phosphodiesterase
MSFSVRFWGVRGTVACASPQYVQFGGNTSCVQVMAGNEQIILDAGTGIRELGSDFLRKNISKASLLLTHTHWDHINGFPFFIPAFQEGGEFRVMAGHLANQEGGIKNVLAGQMAAPWFPVPIQTMRANLAFEDFRAGEDFSLAEDVRVRTCPLNHPNGASGYRIEHQGQSLCYITDTEHVPGKPDQVVLDLIAGADVVIYDATYSDESFPRYVSWGHSTWQEGIRLCQEAKAKKLIIFHHDPNNDDLIMEKVEKDAQAMWDSVLVAREGMEISLKGE